jgi:hypothetical protein
MPDRRTAHKLSAKDQLNLCALLAVGYNSQRCADIFDEEYGIDITPDNVWQNYIQNKKWQKIIKRMQREAERRVLSHPLAKKINRLKLLQDAINEAFTWRLDKIHYDKEGNELSRVEKRNIGMIAALIREARAEIEGDKPLVDASSHLHFSNINIKDLEGKSRQEVIDVVFRRNNNGAIVRKT